MVRECKRLYLEDIFDKVPQLPKNNVELYVDLRNKDEIVDFLREKRKKARRIFYEIFSLRYNYDLYAKEEVSVKAKNITAMKFKGRDNERIYCKEYFIKENNREKKVVMITLYVKKSQKGKKVKNLIETIGGYNYGF